MIQRLTDIYPRPVLHCLEQFAHLGDEWCRVVQTGEHSYSLDVIRGLKLPSFLKKSTDIASFWAGSVMLNQGPKIFRPTLEQCHAMEQVAINLTHPEYQQPYRVTVIDLPKEYRPFIAMVLHKTPDAIMACSQSDDNRNDICFTISNPAEVMENFLLHCDKDITNEIATLNARILRVSLNCCMALTNYGSRLRYLLPKEVQNDERLVARGGKAAGPAKERLKAAVKELVFTQEVTLHETAPGVKSAPGDGTVRTHWRRGHWAKQVCGVGRAERKTIFRKPVLVNADEAIAPITTVYKT